MSSQESRNPYLKAYRDKRRKNGPGETDQDKAMLLFKQMMDIDSIEPLTKAILHMRRMLPDAEVQRQGCFALAVKAITHPLPVIKEGGLDAGLNAMNRHGQNERLQFDGMELLWRLSMDEDGAQAVLDNGGLPAITAAICMHNENVRVQEEASGAIRWLAERDPKRVMDAGGLEAMMRIMENFPQFSWIQMWACGALVKFAELDADRVEDVGGFSAIKAAIKKHEQSPEVQRLGSAALKFDPSFRKKIG